MSEDKDILTPSQIEPNLPNDYSTPNAHCNLNVLQEAEERDSSLKNNQDAGADPEYLAMLDERDKMQKEGKWVHKKELTEKPDDWQIVEKFLINRELSYDEEKGHYVDKRGHIRKDEEKKYPVDVHLLKKICAMHPIIKNVHKLVTFCRFGNGVQKKYVYRRINTADTSCRKVLDKEKLEKIANILELEDWRVLIDKENLDAVTKTDRKIMKIKNEMQCYRSKIKDLQEQLKKQKKGASNE